MLYLDHAATTPMRPEVWAAMEPFATERYGNPSGSHGVSRRAKTALEESRDRAADLLGCDPREIVFTSGGTESDNLAIKGRAFCGDEPGGIVTTAVEHEAVLEAAAFCERFGSPVATVGVGSTGRANPAELASQVTDRTAVVSVMAANNETGVIQPLRRVVEAVAGRAPVHTDAVQMFVSEPLDVAALGVDMLTLAAHKFGGPKGVGLLYVRDGLNLEPVAHGGGQELGRRSGTVDVAGAVGLAEAMALATEDRDRFRRDVGQARLDFEESLMRHAGARRTVPMTETLVQHSHLHFPDVLNETLLINIDQLGLAASVGSACASGAATVSPVLSAMGVGAQQARRSLRFTFGWTTQPDEGLKAAGIVLEALDRVTA